MHARGWASALAVFVIQSGCGGGGGGGSSPSIDDGGSPAQPAQPGPSAPLGLTSTNVFYSGHSLLDEPVGDHTASVAASLGKANQWNQQIVIGSPLRVRTRGWSDTDASFSGYRQGKNRGLAQNLDVVGELRSPTTITGRYDALVLAERHDLASTLQFEDTVRYARHFHERLIEGSPQGTSYLYHAWLGVRDRDNPSSWIASERAAAPVWRCAAARVNWSLAAESRSDRMRYIPAGLALAVLVERALEGRIEGLTGGGRAIIDRLMVDDVHETELGAYVVSLVLFASLYGTSPTGAWAPSGISDGTKRALQSLAWEVASADLGAPGSDLAGCRAYMRDTYCATYNNYVGRPQDIASCQAFFGAPTPGNPFHYEATTDLGYWFAAPR